MMILCCMAASFFCFGSCSDDLNIQQEYPFTVEAMPVADKIASGQTVEIRLEINEEGSFSGTLYTLRYFQPCHFCRKCYQNRKRELPDG